MAYTKRILCLANSRKHAGRCIAGKVFENQRWTTWIRPVSKRQSREISEVERRFEDGTDPKVLDIVTVSFEEPMPENFQTENHLIDDNFYWNKRGVATWTDVQSAVDAPQSLWINGQSTYNGQNDKIAIDEANKLTSSLLLITPTNLRLQVALEGYCEQKRQVRASFDLNGTHYKLKVTDPAIERLYLQQPNGVYPIQDAALCISLGEEFQGHTFKLVASVITPT